MSPQEQNFKSWKKDFLIATKLDRTNKIARAIASYEIVLDGLNKFIDADAENNICILQLKDAASKIMHCIKNRILVLTTNNEHHWPSLEELMKLKPVFSNNIHKWSGESFPILIVIKKEKEVPRNSSPTSRTSVDSELQDTSTSVYGVIEPLKELQPPIEKHEGYHRLALDLFKIGLKYSRCLLKPFLSISLRDPDSVLLTSIVNTPILKTFSGDCHYLLNYRFNIQMYLEKIPKASAVFFELKHTVEKRVETKYFAILPKDYLKSGNVFLEIFKGPVDYHRKRLKKMSESKPLYLHLTILETDTST